MGGLWGGGWINLLFASDNSCFGGEEAMVWQAGKWKWKL